MNPLHVYLIEEGWGEHHHYIAESPEEALTMFALDMYGDTVEEWRKADDTNAEDTSVTIQPDDRLLTINEADDEGGPARTETMARWVEERGKGCLCTSVV